jgi:hypothetical protein
MRRTAHEVYNWVFIAAIIASAAWLVDRPIVMTIAGSVLLTLATTLWTTHQQRLTPKFELLQAMPVAFQKTGNNLNHWIVNGVELGSLVDSRPAA